MINARETTDRKDLKLPEKQSRNLDAVISMNPDAVLFMVSGYPYELEKRHIATVMHICHAGPAMGQAVAETLFGDISPAGRCRSPGISQQTNCATSRTTTFSAHGLHIFIMTAIRCSRSVTDSAILHLDTWL